MQEMREDRISEMKEAFSEAKKLSRQSWLLGYWRMDFAAENVENAAKEKTTAWSSFLRR